MCALAPRAWSGCDSQQQPALLLLCGAAEGLRSIPPPEPKGRSNGSVVVGGVVDSESSGVAAHAPPKRSDFRP